MDLTKDTRRTVWMSVLLGGLTLAVFWPVVHNDFINYDDTAYVTENPQVLTGLTWAGVGWAFRSGYFGNWHPLTWLSHMLDVQLFGLAPGGHHFTNLLFHTANTVLLFLVLRRLTGAAWRSGCVAALFALHPLHVESVAWVSERKDVLSAFFFLLTLLAYARYVEGRRKNAECRMEVAPGANRATRSGSCFCLLPSTFYLLSLLLFALGLMSKAMLVTLPFVLLLLDYWPLGRLSGRRQEECRVQNGDADPTPHAPRTSPQSQIANRKSQILLRLLREKVPFFALAALSTGVGVFLLRQVGATNEPPDVGLGDRLVRSFVGYGQYLAKAIWPTGLALPYARPAQWPLGRGLAGAVCVAGLSFAAIRLAGRWRYLPVGWFWFLGMLLPVIGFIPVGADPFADRYTYLPLIGLLMVLVWGAADLASGWRQPRALLAGAMSVTLAGCLVATRVQIGYWRNNERLYRHALKVTAGNYLAHNGLALHLFQQGKVDEAIQHYEAALQLNPLYDPAHSNLGRALAEKGDFARAQEHLETALRLRPDDVKARNNLGNILVQQGRHEEAVRQFEEVVRLKPDHAGAHNNLAISCRKLGRIGEAIKHYREGLRLQPDSVQALNNLAWLLAACPDARFRDGAEAEKLARQACELTRYQNPIPLATLAAAHAEAGRYAEAVAYGERARELVGSGQPAVAARLSAMVEEFRAGRPYHAD